MSKSTNARNIWRTLLIVLIGLHILVHIAFGFQLSFSPEAVAKATGLEFAGISPIANWLIVWVAAVQSFIVAISAFSLYWVIKREPIGMLVGLIIGVFLIVLGTGLVGFAMSNNISVGGGLFDIVRGSLTVLFGLLTLRSLKRS